MQVKITMRYYYTPNRMVKGYTLTITNAIEDVKHQEFSFSAGRNTK